MNSDCNKAEADYEAKWYVKGLCCDVDSRDERMQRTLLHSKTKDYISDNTDFSHINDRPIKDVYFSLQLSFLAYWL